MSRSVVIGTSSNVRYLSENAGIIANDPVEPQGFDMGPSYARFIPVSLIQARPAGGTDGKASRRLEKARFSWHLRLLAV